MKNLRFWAAVLLLAATALLLHLRANVDRNPPSEPLSQLPKPSADGRVEI